MIKKNKVFDRDGFCLVLNMASSCDPPHWDSHKRRNDATLDKNCRKNKKSKTVDESNEGLNHIASVVSTFIQQNRSVDESESDISALLDTIPFVKMLSDVNTDVNGPAVPLVTRGYEEKYMRQCIGEHEVPCVMQSQCECMNIDFQNAFVGVSFVVPSETSINNGMCILCLRKTTQMLFYKTIHCGHTVNACIQKYGNICNEPGEYHPSAMLICPPNGPVHSMPLPIVAHQRNKYSVVERAGVLWIKQHNVLYEDFT